MRRSIGGLDDETIRSIFCNDMDDEQTRFMLERTGTEAAVILAEPVSRAGIPAELPKTFVKLLRDQSLAPEVQDVLIQNLRDSPGGDVNVVTIDASPRRPAEASSASSASQPGAPLRPPSRARLPALPTPESTLESSSASPRRTCS